MSFHTCFIASIIILKKIFRIIIILLLLLVILRYCSNSLILILTKFRRKLMRNLRGLYRRTVNFFKFFRHFFIIVLNYHRIIVRKYLFLLFTYKVIFIFGIINTIYQLIMTFTVRKQFSEYY
jgi:hypothetical protein